MEMQKPIRLTKLPKNPVGFLPVMVTPPALRQKGVPPYTLILVKDEEREPRFGSHLIEICETVEQAQTLLEFYLTNSYLKQVVDNCTVAAEAGIVVPLRLDHVFAWLLKTQVALPLETRVTVQRILRQARIDSFVRYYERRPWRNTEMGKVLFNLVSVHDDDRQRLAEIVVFLKSKSGGP